MFNIEEFYKARERLFENQDNIHTLPDLKNYLSDLNIVCANERSSDLANLLSVFIELAKTFNDDNILFELYWEYFFQTYYFVKELKKTEKIVDELRLIAKRTNCINHLSIVYQAESLVKQLLNKKSDAINLMNKSLTLIESMKDVYPLTYYRALYSHTYFLSQEQHRYTETIENIENCLAYYSNSNSMRGLMLVIHLLLKIYTFTGKEKSIEDLLQWVLNNDQIQNNLLHSHSISLNCKIGISYTIRNKLDDAIDYLEKAYSKVNEQNLQNDMMYEYTDILRFLSRCYAYQGKFQLAYDLLVDLANFMEDEYVKSNYYARGKKYIFVSSYYTLLFIFIQLDLNIENVKNEKLREIYEYTNSLLNKSKVSEKLILSVFSEDKNIQEIFHDNIDESETEISIILRQLLLTHVPYKNQEKNIPTIEKLRKYAIEPLYADILLGKILISMGNYDKFKEIVNRIVRETTETKAPILKIWRDFYVLLDTYLDDPNNKDIVEELVRLEEYCRKNNFVKMEEEIQMYHRLISSTKTINKFSDKFKQTAFMDIFDIESKRMAIEFLDSKNS
ncbi:MAG: hypothetical protein ACTSQ4_10520 [Candidatus Heimdallarchaeaceae archaeon]